MMGRWLGTVLWVWLIAPAIAASLDAASINNAEYRSTAPPKLRSMPQS